MRKGLSIIRELDVLDERLDTQCATSRTSRRTDQVECRVEHGGTPIHLVGVPVRQGLPESGDSHDVCGSRCEPEKIRAIPADQSGMGSWIGLGSLRTAFLGSMCPPERETG
jgi:hypothetical protein